MEVLETVEWDRGNSITVEYWDTEYKYLVAVRRYKKDTDSYEDIPPEAWLPKENCVPSV